MSNLLYSLYAYLKRMGCVLFRQTITIDGDKYTITRQLAEGGFSTIDLARKQTSNQLVAIKRIICHSIQDQNLAKFEIEVNQQFVHSNLIPILGSCLVGEADIIHNKTSEVYLVFPYYPRGSLQDELQRRYQTNAYLDESMIIDLFRGVCCAVRVLHCHDPPFAHRDIKPHNILLEKDFNPILMDLGSVAPARVKIRSCRDAQFLQDTAAERSSMTYRPPELFMVPTECDITEKTDIWSLGCLLYALMYFKSPFDSVYERGDSVALAVQSGNVIIPGESGAPCFAGQPVYSAQLRDLMLKMLNLDLSFRPSIDGVIDTLQQLPTQVKDQHLVVDFTS